jgi:DNA-binding response OmpR family regulator
MTVLICEDDAALAFDMQEALQQAGIENVRISRNAEETRHQAAVAVAVVDVNLDDGRSGPGIARDLQASGTEVILVSGDPSIPAEVCDFPHIFLAKPFPYEVMVDCVLAALMRAGGGQGGRAAELLPAGA